MRPTRAPAALLATALLALASVRPVAAEDVPPAPPPAPASAPAAPDAPAAPGKAPRIAFDREAHDFGVAAQEEELKTTFTVKNEGTDVLRLLDLRSDCGCGAATTESREVAAGGTATIEVTLRTLTLAGLLNKRILLTTNDPVRPTPELKLRVDVSAGIVLVPARFFFGDVPAGTAPTATLKAMWKEGVGTPFRVTGVEAPGFDLALETKPYEEGAWRGFVVSATFRSPPGVGAHSGTALIRTDDPKRPRFVVGVQAYVSGKVWVDRREVNLGMVAEGKGRQTAVRCRGFGADVDLGTVTAAATKGRVEAKAILGGKDWIVTIRLPESAPPGNVEDVVEIRSSIPGEPPALVEVKGYVSAKAAK